MQLDGGDHLGYVVAHRATGIAVEKASAVGIAVVGASDTWYTGMLFMPRSPRRAAWSA